MKILFVNPRFPRSLWGFQGITDLVGVRSGQAPLGLATVAALTPPEIEVGLVDENCDPVPLDTDAEVVAIGCWNVQYRRAQELAREFRRRGKLVVVGGPYPTLCPERFTDGTFDVLFDGEVEVTWPRFCRDLLAGTPQPVYKQSGNVDVRLSPVPRFDLLRPGDYIHYFVQTTRGCPFQCEFCDIIITDGRVPRTKAVEQVIREVEAIQAIGGRYASFSDANFIGNQRYAEELLVALRDYNRARGYPLGFSAEMTINVAERPQLLQLMREANFTGIFLGIESPRIDSLVGTKKRQNVHKPLLESIRRIQSYNLIVTAGMIVGFDHDDVRIFQEQFDFLMEAGIPFTTCGVLTAIEKTPLHARLAKEGRLLDMDSADRLGHGSADLNFVPKLMSPEELRQGYNWLIRALYRYDNYGRRLTTALGQFRTAHDASGRGAQALDRSQLLVALRVVRHFLLTTSRARRRFFVRTLREALAAHRTADTLVTAISYLVAHKHFHEYVSGTHGDPETVAPLSPFSEGARLTDWASRELSDAYFRRLRRRAGLGAEGLRTLWRRPRRAVAVPEAVLAEKVGQALRHYLDELGVEVVPVATAALSRLRDRVDLLVLPIVGSVRKGREELHQVVQQLNERVQADLDKLPRIMRVSLDGDHRAMLDGFARIGLTFTRRVQRLRRAYLRAVEAAMLGPTAAPGPAEPARTT
jgi:radical SAM superfamily enzyme YgiQ (UPF0313 family)